VFHHRTISPVLAANSAYGKTTPVDIVSAYPANLSHCWGYNADGTPWTREQWNMYDPPRGSSSHLGQGGSGS
jgi:hypothetical protein